MSHFYNLIHELFMEVPETALFISLALGYLVGRIKFGKVQLGGAAGSLFVAVLISQFGVHIDETIKNLLFILFIYTVGFTSGPTFFRLISQGAVKEIWLSAVLALSGLVTVVALAHLLKLDQGLAAGIAAGGLTQSAIMGTAESAILALNLGPKETADLMANISVGYGVTYIFGSFGAIVVCVYVLPWFMGRSLREDAVKAEADLHRQRLSLGDDQELAAPDLVERIYLAGASAGQTVAEVERAAARHPVTIERLKRGRDILPATPETIIQDQDKLLVIGRRSDLLAVRHLFGAELADEPDLEMPIQTRSIVVGEQKAVGQTLDQLWRSVSRELRHGLYIISVQRGSENLSATSNLTLERGDILKVYGAEQDLKRLAPSVGYILTQNDKTDFVYLGLGLAVGLLIGIVNVRIGDLSVTLGQSCGALLAGLIFGWLRTRRAHSGALPDGAARLLRDLGLAGFVAVVGLNYGLEAIATIKAQGLNIFAAGLLVTLIPLCVAMLFGRYVLHYDNAAVFAGALSGSRSANPAFGEVLNKAENSVPTLPFAITYALANVFLTLLGPLIVALT